MKKILAFRALLAAALLWAASLLPAAAQTAPNWSYGQVPTVAQWNAVFAAKQDYLGAPPLLTTGGTMLGKLVTAASSSSVAGFNLQIGSAPSAPINGDIWATSGSLYARIGGVTYDLIGATAVSITVGITTVLSGTDKGLLYNNAGVVGNLATANSGVLVTNGSGVPSISSTLPNGLALGSPGSIGTLPAFTLGGTISGGGNQINNVIIGSTSPLAGSFTSLSYSTTLTGTTTNAACAAIGRQGATAPAFQVDCSTASQATGVKITGAAAAGGVALAAISSGTNEALTIDAKGSGSITLGGTSTGNIVLSRAAVLGVAGSVNGSATFANTTSGGITVSPPAGALGTVTNSLQAATDTFVYRATTDTLTNKTLTASSNVLGGVTMTLGSDATGDVYYRNSGGVLTRLPIGTNTQVLTISAGLPSWQAASSAASITVGTTTINSGTTNNLLYNNAGTLANGTIASFLTAGGGIDITGTTNATIALRAPSVQVLTASSGTYTTPAGVKYIWVRGCGGGGGSGTTAGGTGGTTTFSASTMSATGGAGSSGVGGTAAAGGAGTNGQVNYTGGAGMGTVTTTGAMFMPIMPGGASFMFPATASAPAANTCTGAPTAITATAGANTGGSGGGGGGFERIVPNPSATYSYANGAGGTAGTNGSVGGSGVIVVWEF